jgi:VanZ family protein
MKLKKELKSRAIWITIILGTLYGLGDEWHQAFVPGREASLWDALFDSLGVLTAAGTYRMLTERIRSLNRSFNGPEREVIHEEKTGNHH